MMDYIEPLQNLINQFKKLPGIGGKTAVRLAFSVLDMSEEEASEFSSAILGAKADIHFCEVCGNISETTLCPICQDEGRDESIICVVEHAKDVMSFERIREFRGRYHVLGGVLSPINGIGPDEIRIKELLLRLENEKIKEIVIATNPTVEGEATAMYLARLLASVDVAVSRLAYGVPVGADLEYADEVTLNRALEGRRSIK
jgi:recombination protein RecR